MAASKTDTPLHQHNDRPPCRVSWLRRFWCVLRHGMHEYDVQSLPYCDERHKPEHFLFFECKHCKDKKPL